MTEPRAKTTGTKHEPKIAALSAYAENVLSAEGMARMERHLERCSECRRALASIDLYRSTSEQIRMADVPAIEWSKMELALAREARELSAKNQAAAVSARNQAGEHDAARKRRARAQWTGVLVLAAAAAAVLALGVWPGADAPIADRRTDADERPDDAPVRDVAPEAGRIAGVVTLVAGSASVIGSSSEAAVVLAVGDAIEEGARIETAAASEAHVRLADGTGLIAQAETALTMTRLREDGIDIALEHGRVSSTVREGTIGGSRFVVLAEEIRFEARATRFEVELEGDVVRLGVSEGTVAVHRPDGTVELIHAPASWSSAGAAAAPSETAEVSTPHGLGEDPSAWPVLSVSHPEIVRWEIGGAELVGAGAIAMSVPAGEIAITGFDARGRAFRALAVVGSADLVLATSELQAEPPRMREGFLRIEDIQDVVQRGRPRIQQCYEQALRASHDDVAGQLVVEIRVGLDGSVTRTRFTGDEVLPEAFQACVRTQIERWSFPSPVGGTVTFSVPFRFRSI